MTVVAAERDVMGTVSRLLAERLGLSFPEDRWGDLARGLHRAGAELGISDLRTWTRWLSAPGPTARQFEALVAHLTVAETFFFRDPAIFEFLEHELLPPLVERRARGNRTLRLWSAGCATGEEAYSLAIVCRRALALRDGWNLSILGTDLSPRALAKAEAGAYSPWSFRGVPRWVRERHFSTRPGNRFAVEPSIKAMVRFAYLNLAQDTYPSLHNATNAMDVIFCRNVLMYLTPEHQRNVVEALHRSLVEGGYLVVGGAEASHKLFAGFEQVRTGDAILYRKNGSQPHRSTGAQTGTAAHTVTAPTPTPSPATPPLPTVPPPPGDDAPGGNPGPPLHDPREASQDVSSRERNASPVLLSREPDTLARARALADSGRLEEALGACGRAIEADRTNATAHFLSGIISEELGRPAEAILALNRVLYLDGDFILAHHALGSLYRRLGQVRNSRRHLAILRELLAVRGHDELVPESDGMTCGRLLESVRATLEA